MIKRGFSTPLEMTESVRRSSVTSLYKYWLNIIHMTNRERIISLLDSLGIPYDLIEHEESHTCEDSKRLRDAAGMVGQGSKNIIFHARGRFYLVTTLADKSIKARNFKHEFGTKDIRFASQEEISPILNATIGSIPPFGFGNIEIPLYVDEEIFDAEYFIFNPSVPTESLRIATIDLRQVYESLGNPVKYFRASEEEFMVQNFEEFNESNDRTDL